MQVPGKFISVADLFPPAYQKEPCGHCLKIEAIKILAEKLTHQIIERTASEWKLN